jgi:hypothetical protein
MNDISESPAFQEFLQKRYEEITANDEEYRSINKKILTIEKEFVPLLPPDLLKQYLEIDNLNFKIINRLCFLTTDKITINR